MEKSFVYWYSIPDCSSLLTFFQLDATIIISDIMVVPREKTKDGESYLILFYQVKDSHVTEKF